MKPEETKTDAARVRFPPPLIFLIAILLGAALHRFLAPFGLDMLGSVPRLALGTLLVALGLSAIGLAFFHFAKTHQNPEPWKPTPEIISAGIYAFTRNPMYLGMALAQAGAGLLVSQLWIVLMVAPALLATTLIAIGPEESYLEAKFGEEYTAYKSRVGRWL